MESAPHIPSFLGDRYDIERELGRGGMSTVYLAHDRRHDRQVAIKVLRPDLVSSVGAERFVREIQIAAQLTHPHILPLLDSGEAQGQPYYVMPFVAGESLRARLVRQGALPVEESTRIAITVARALEHAHALGVVHRDIKPENVLMASGEPVVADFGIARAVSAAAGDTLTSTGVAIGTPTYMSPEQASGERVVDGRTDVYALAVMLYEMLAGEPPYTGPTAQAIAARKVTSPPPSIRVIRPAVSAALDETLRRALEPNPADRLHSARQFAESLEMTLRDSVVGARGASGVRRVGLRVWRVAATWRTVALVAIGFMISALMWPWRDATDAKRVIRLTLPTGTLAVTDHGPAPVVAISPDGQLIAYVAGVGGSGQLWLRRLDAATATPVKDAPHAQGPFFSPDGNWLGFVEESRGTEHAVLKKVRLADGEQFVVCPAPDAHGATWLRDGRIVIGGMGSNGYSLSIVSAEGGKSEPIVKPDVAKQEMFLVHPSALPDGSGVLFTAVGATGQAISVNVADLDTWKRSLVMTGGGASIALSSGMLVYAADGSLFAHPFDIRGRRLTGKAERIVPDVLMNLPLEPELGHFALGGAGTLAYLAGDARSFRGSQVSWVDSAGRRTLVADEVRVPASAGGGPLTVGGPRWSPRGDRMIFWATAQGNDATPVGLFGDVWMFDSRTGEMSRVFPESRYFWPIWSPDGEWVIAPRAEDSLNATALFRRRANGQGAPERLTAAIPDRYMQPYGISRDGSVLFYQVTTTTRDGGSDIYMLHLEGDRTPTALFATAAPEYGPAPSPDGKWLAYTMAEKERPPQVYVTDFPARTHRWQVSFEGGAFPVWSDDGRWLFFAVSAGGESGVDRVRFTSTQDPPVGRPESFARSPAVWVNVGAPYGRSFDISGDGRRVLTTSGGNVGGGRVDTAAVRELSVIVNWRATLRQF